MVSGSNKDEPGQGLLLIGTVLYSLLIIIGIVREEKWSKWQITLRSILKNPNRYRVMCVLVCSVIFRFIVCYLLSSISGLIYCFRVLPSFSNIGLLEIGVFYSVVLFSF